MLNPIKNYKWWIKIFAAALLLVVGLWVLLDKEFGGSLVVAFTGAAVIIFALIRVVALIRTMKTRNGRLVTLGEITLFVILGAIMLAGGIFLKSDPEHFLATLVNDYYKYFLGGVLYLRAVSYFITTVLCKEETNKTLFWTHIATITLSCVILSLDNFTAKDLSIVVAILALICSTGLIIEGGFNYYRYRQNISKKEEVKKEKKKSKDAPAKDDGKIINDETPIINEVPTDDRPYVN